jgi:methyl-accepting chemotaxis protein
MKIMLIVGLFGLFVLGVAFYSSSQISAIGSHYNSLLEGQSSAATDLTSASRYMQATRASIGDLGMDYTDAQNAASLAEMKSDLTNFGQIMEQAANVAPDHATEYQSFKQTVLDTINNKCDQTIRDMAAATTPTAILSTQREYLGQCAPLFSPLLNEMAAKVTTLRSEVAAVAGQVKAQTSRTILTTYAGNIIGLIIITTLAIFGARAWIIAPIRRQLDFMSQLTNGNYDITVEGTERGDEVGAIARTVAVFRDAGRDKIRLEAETAQQRAHAEEQRQHQEAIRAQAAQQASLVVESLAIGLEKLSAGDLIFRLNQSFAAEYEKLRHDFNGAIDKLQETMISISTNTQGVRSGAGEISQASDDLSRRTEQQAASLEETAAALDEITATVRKTAENATAARSTAATAKDDAEQSGAVVRETVGAMSGIENSSKQISNIIGVIDEIAFQTNLLALNAGVEAARAGEAGRGFAVVATEVRALAQRSADAAKEIKALISTSSREVESGVRLVGETGRALDRIVDQVGRLNALISDIAASAQEQATGLAEVNTAMNQMDQVTQQNAAMVEEATAASHSLAKEAEALGRLVAQFSLGDSPAGPGAPAKRAGGPAAARSPAPRPRPAAGPSRPAAPARAMAAAGGDDGDGWNEF